MEELLDYDVAPESLIHDLNNVFETVIEAAEVLSADKHWKPLAATLKRSVARGKRLLGAIPDRTPDFSAVLEDAIQSVTDYCVAGRHPRLRFTRQIPADLRLPGSAKDWERVFANLFLNAAQVMQRPGRIEVSACKAADSITITVSDNGPGIPPEILPSVFRPHVSTKTVAAGRSGLGLHIVSSIVKKHSGRISAANRERGTGAIFTILLPST